MFNILADTSTTDLKDVLIILVLILAVIALFIYILRRTR